MTLRTKVHCSTDKYILRSAIFTKSRTSFSLTDSLIIPFKNNRRINSIVIVDGSIN